METAVEIKQGSNEEFARWVSALHVCRLVRVGFVACCYQRVDSIQSTVQFAFSTPVWEVNWYGGILL